VHFGSLPTSSIIRARAHKLILSQCNEGEEKKERDQSKRELAGTVSRSCVATVETPGSSLHLNGPSVVKRPWWRRSESPLTDIVHAQPRLLCPFSFSSLPFASLFLSILSFYCILFCFYGSWRLRPLFADQLPVVHDSPHSASTRALHRVRAHSAVAKGESVWWWRSFDRWRRSQSHFVDLRKGPAARRPVRYGLIIPLLPSSPSPHAPMSFYIIWRWQPSKERNKIKGRKEDTNLFVDGPSHLWWTVSLCYDDSGRPVPFLSFRSLSHCWFFLFLRLVVILYFFLLTICPWSFYFSFYFHVPFFVYIMSSGILGVSYRLTQGVVKHIIPAVASTNAVVAAACAIEVFKMASSCASKLDNYMVFNDTDGKKEQSCYYSTRLLRYERKKGERGRDFLLYKRTW